MKTIMIHEMPDHVGETVRIGAWLANKRSSGKIAFLQLRDGSGFVQGVVVKEEVGEEIFAKAKSITQETSLYITAEVTVDERSTFGYELQVKDIEVIHEAVDYPITPKEHGTEFLMDHRHLWFRSRKQHAIMKIRNEVIRATYEFFHMNGFVKVDPPILTGSSPEGTSELFETKYFDEDAFLSQSGQLYMEAAAMALGKVFSFGPTFRAEKSKTRRHLIEFWMIEPEMAFVEFEESLEVQEQYVTHVVQSVLQNCPIELRKTWIVICLNLKKFKHHSHVFHMMMQSNSYMKKDLMILNGEMISVHRMKQRLQKAMICQYSSHIIQLALNHSTCNHIQTVTMLSYVQI